jgi:hypothetical protein
MARLTTITEDFVPLPVQSLDYQTSLTLSRLDADEHDSSVAQDFAEEDRDVAGEHRRFTPLGSRVVDHYEVLPRPDFLNLPSTSYDVHQTRLSVNDYPVLNYGTEDVPRALDHGAEGSQPSIANLTTLTEATSIPLFSTASPVAEETPSAASTSSYDHEDMAPSVSIPEVVYDSDPPFRTDGRGRVVWSSSTATRGRRSRTSTYTAGAAPPTPQQHDKPCEVVVDVSDRSSERFA